MSVLVSPCTIIVPFAPHFGQSAIPFQVPMENSQVKRVPIVATLAYRLYSKCDTSPILAGMSVWVRDGRDSVTMCAHMANFDHLWGLNSRMPTARCQDPVAPLMSPSYVVWMCQQAKLINTS